MFRIEKSRVIISEIRELATKTDDAADHDEAAVIEAPEVRPDPLETAQKLAEELLLTASNEAEAKILRADEVLREAKAAAEELKNEAMKAGYELGVSEGEAEGQRRYDALIKEQSKALKNVLAEIKRAGDTMISDMENDIIDLCFSVLLKITSLDRMLDGEIFKSIIRKAMSQVDLTGKVSIRLSHEDFERFFPEGTAVFDINDKDITASVSSDPEFRGGDIAVDTDSETVVAGAAAQLKNIEIAFRHRLGR